MPGTTINHLKPYDVIISIDLQAYVRDGGKAYISQNGVVLFPNRVEKKYLVDAFDRKKNKMLFCTASGN